MIKTRVIEINSESKQNVEIEIAISNRRIIIIIKFNYYKMYI